MHITALINDNPRWCDMETSVAIQFVITTSVRRTGPIRPVINDITKKHTPSLHHRRVLDIYSNETSGIRRHLAVRMISLVWRCCSFMFFPFRSKRHWNSKQNISSPWNDVIFASFFPQYLRWPICVCILSGFVWLRCLMLRRVLIIHGHVSKPIEFGTNTECHSLRIMFHEDCDRWTPVPRL